MESNLNKAPDSLSKQELNQKLRNSRELVVKIVKNNLQSQELVIGKSEAVISRDSAESQRAIDSTIGGFIAEIGEMVVNKEISEAKYWEQLVELYSELLISEQERLMASGLSEAEARAQNRWVSETEDVFGEANYRTLARAKEEEGESSEKINSDLKQLRELLQVRAEIVIPEKTSSN